jgi:hypothetical protein
MSERVPKAGEMMCLLDQTHVTITEISADGKAYYSDAARNFRHYVFLTNLVLSETGLCWNEVKR